MTENVLVLSSSLRKNGNSAALAQEFARGAREAGKTVELLHLCDYDLQYCRGCLACGKTKRCVIKDDGAALIAAVSRADAVVFATPIYYYSVSGLMKTMLDRTNPLYETNYKFRDVYLLTAAADNEDWVPQGAVTALKGWLQCYPKSRLAGTVFAGGVNQAGEIAGHSALQQAYEMGKRV